MKLIDFWDKIAEYPDVLEYFDNEKNIEFSMKDIALMWDFIYANEDEEVIDFEVRFNPHKVRVEFGKEKEKK